MAYSPLPSPAFSNASGSTQPSTVSTIKSNAKNQFSDLKNLILNRAVSANVKRERVLAVIKAFNSAIDALLQQEVIVGSILKQSGNPEAHQVAMALARLFMPAREQIIVCRRRMQLAADSFRRLEFYERGSRELTAQVNRLSKDICSASDDSRKEAFKKALQNVDLQRYCHAEVFSAMSEIVCRDIVTQVISSMQETSQIMMKTTQKAQQEAKIRLIKE